MFTIDILIGVAQIDNQLLSLLNILSNHVDVFHFQHFDVIIDSQKWNLHLHCISSELLVDQVSIRENSLNSTQWLVASQNINILYQIDFYVVHVLCLWIDLSYYHFPQTLGILGFFSVHILQPYFYIELLFQFFHFFIQWKVQVHFLPVDQ